MGDGKQMRRAFLAGLLASALIQTAHGDDISALKGINTITYHLLSSRHLRESGDDKQDKRCVVDWSRWRTNTEFAVNQSPELHFIEEADYSREVNRRYATLPKLDDPAYTEAARKASAYNFMPTLSVIIRTAVIDSGCFAEVEANVEMTLHGSQAWANDYPIRNPIIQVWSSTTWWKGPQNSFNHEVLPISDQLIEEFVNVWNRAQ
jgi:hypothetical protein